MFFSGWTPYQRLHQGFAMVFKHGRKKGHLSYSLTVSDNSVCWGRGYNCQEETVKQKTEWAGLKWRQEGWCKGQRAEMNKHCAVQLSLTFLWCFPLGALPHIDHKQFHTNTRSHTQLPQPSKWSGVHLKTYLEDDHLLYKGKRNVPCVKVDIMGSVMFRPS